MILETIQYKNYQNKLNKTIAFEVLLGEKKLDIEKFKKFLGYYYTLQTSDKTKLNFFTLEALEYIEAAFKRIQFTPTQRDYLTLHMSGYKTKEIADHFGVTQVAVRKTLTLATSKIISTLYKMKEEDNLQ